MKYYVADGVTHITDAGLRHSAISSNVLLFTLIITGIIAVVSFIIMRSDHAEGFWITLLKAICIWLGSFVAACIVLTLIFCVFASYAMLFFFIAIIIVALSALSG